MLTRKYESCKVTKFAMRESISSRRKNSKTHKSSAGLWTMAPSCWKSVTISVPEEYSPIPP